MMAEFPKDAADFKRDLALLGIALGPYSAGDIAFEIGYTEGYVVSLLNGGKRYPPGARTKIGVLIAAKANGPGDKDEVFAPIIARASDVPIPSADSVDKNRRYMVIHMDLGEYALVEVLAPFRDAGTANLICGLLNKEAG